MVAALERQHTFGPLGDDSTQHHWLLSGEGIRVDLVVYASSLGAAVAWMGVHAKHPFAVEGEPAVWHETCKALNLGGWCWIDASRGDPLVDRTEVNLDPAPIWAALEALAGEVQW